MPSAFSPIIDSFAEKILPGSASNRSLEGCTPSDLLINLENEKLQAGID
jgi:hypothetical protein